MAPSLRFICNFNWLAAVVGANRGKFGCNNALTGLVLSQALGLGGQTLTLPAAKQRQA
jgi:hypothetical protein